MQDRTTGFTLIELLVGIAVLAIVLAAAVPGFQVLVNGNRLAAAANEMVGSLQSARMEAIRRNRRVVVCASADANAGTAATCADAGANGWITFVDNDRNGAFGAGDALLRNSLVDDSIDVSGAPAVVFRSDGLARDQARGPARRVGADRARCGATGNERPLHRHPHQRRGRGQDARHQ